METTGLRYHSNISGPMALTVIAEIGASVLTVASTANTPAAPFLIGANRGDLAKEEIMLCTDKSGTTLTVTRGYDGSTEREHQIGDPIEHVVAAIDYREANEFVNLMTTKGDLLTRSATEIIRVPVGADAEALISRAADASGLDWRPVTFRVPHTWAIPGEVKVAVGEVDYLPGFFLPEPAGVQSVKVVATRHRINIGTSATVKLQKDGVDLTGFTGISVTSTSTTTDPADQDITDAQKLDLIVTAVSATTQNMSFTTWVDYTLAV